MTLAAEDLAALLGANRVKTHPLDRLAYARSSGISQGPAEVVVSLERTKEAAGVVRIACWPRSIPAATAAQPPWFRISGSPIQWRSMRRPSERRRNSHGEAARPTLARGKITGSVRMGPPPAPSTSPIGQ